MDDVVKLYVDSQFRGRVSELPIGEYATASDYNKFGVVNDDISSVKVPAGLKLTMFEHQNFGGKTVEAFEDIDDLASLGFNDKSSSFKVEKVKEVIPSNEIEIDDPNVKKKISTFGWVMIGFGSLALTGLMIFGIYKLTRKK